MLLNLKNIIITADKDELWNEKPNIFFDKRCKFLFVRTLITYCIPTYILEYNWSETEK